MRGGHGHRHGRNGPNANRRSKVLLVAGTISLNALLVCMWLWWAFGTQNGFADLSVDMLKDPGIRSVAAEQVVKALESQGMTSQVAIAAGPALEPVVASVVGTDAFKGLVYAGARQLHETIFLGNNTRMVVQVDDAGQMVKDSLRVVNPGLADTIPDSAIDIAVGVSQDTRLDALIHAAALTGWMIWPLAAVTLACYAAAIKAAGDRRRAVLRLGLLLFASGVLWFLALVTAVTVVSRFVDGAIDRMALRAAFRAVTHVLMLSTRTVLNAGIVLTLAALVAGEERVRSKIRTAATWARTEWDRPVLHGVLGLLIVVIGVLVTVYPEVVLALVARTTGLLLAFVGLVAVLDVLGAYGWSVEEGAEGRTLRHVVVIAGAAATSIAVLLTFGGVTLYDALHSSRAANADPSRGCNGHVELCDRRLDQVVLAGTHNAMSASAERGWYFARQTGGIGAQLSKGVRAFLLDAHYGTPVGGIVRTDFESETDRAASDEQLTEEQRAVLGRLLGLIGMAKAPDAPRKVYLCHLFCEMGATPAIDAFRKIDGFLAENPNEVVVVVVEDHARPEDIEDVLRKSGLAEHAYPYVAGHALPTLRRMIETRKNLLVMAETSAGASPWYAAGYDRLLQDTPYRFRTLDEMSCTLERGRSSNVLLLVNHWLAVDPTSPAIAAKANAREALEARVAGCRAARGRLPNIIAVDFYASGDLFTVVDELNGVAKASATTVPSTAVPSTTVPSTTVPSTPVPSTTSTTAPAA